MDSRDIFSMGMRISDRHDVMCSPKVLGPHVYVVAGGLKVWALYLKRCRLHPGSSLALPIPPTPTYLDLPM